VDYGSTISTTDGTALTGGTTYYYRVQAIDDGFNTPYEQLYNPTSALFSGWSNVATISPVPIIGVAPTSLAFGTVAVGSSSISAPVIISNTGTATLNISSMTSSAPDFVPTLCSLVTAGQTCSFTVTFSPSAGGPQSATLTIASDDPARPTVLVSMTGTGVVGTGMTIQSPAITYGANGVITVSVEATTGTVSPTGNVTLAVDGGAPLMQTLSAGSATFNLTAPAAGSHTLVANYAAQNGFQQRHDDLRRTRSGDHPGVQRVCSRPGRGDCVDHAADLHHDRDEREFSGVLSDHVLGCSLAELCDYLR
jgi:hypothetical protein